MFCSIFVCFILFLSVLTILPYFYPTCPFSNLLSVLFYLLSAFIRILLVLSNFLSVFVFFVDVLSCFWPFCTILIALNCFGCYIRCFLLFVRLPYFLSILSVLSYIWSILSYFLSVLTYFCPFFPDKTDSNTTRDKKFSFYVS